MHIDRYIPPSFDTALDEALPKRAAYFSSITTLEKKVEPPPPPPPPTFSEEGLKAAEQAGHRRGFIEGEAEGKKIAESQLAQIERNIQALMTPLAVHMLEQMKHYNRFVREEQEATPYLAHAIAKKIAGGSLKADALPFLERQVKECIATMLGVPKIVVTVNETLAERFEEKLNAYFANSSEPGEIIIHGDASMAEADCKVEWAHGLARISQAERLQRLDTLVAEIAADRSFNHTPFSPSTPEEATGEDIL